MPPNSVSNKEALFHLVVLNSQSLQIYLALRLKAIVKTVRFWSKVIISSVVSRLSAKLACIAKQPAYTCMNLPFVFVHMTRLCRSLKIQRRTALFTTFRHRIFYSSVYTYHRVCFTQLIGRMLTPTIVISVAAARPKYAPIMKFIRSELREHKKEANITEKCNEEKKRQDQI